MRLAGSGTGNVERETTLSADLQAGQLCVCVLVCKDDPGIDQVSFHQLGPVAPCGALKGEAVENSSKRPADVHNIIVRAAFNHDTNHVVSHTRCIPAHTRASGGSSAPLSAHAIARHG